MRRELHQNPAVFWEADPSARLLWQLQIPAAPECVTTCQKISLMFTVHDEEEGSEAKQSPWHPQPPAKELVRDQRERREAGTRHTFCILSIMVSAMKRCWKRFRAKLTMPCFTLALEPTLGKKPGWRELNSEQLEERRTGLSLFWGVFLKTGQGARPSLSPSPPLHWHLPL